MKGTDMKHNKKVVELPKRVVRAGRSAGATPPAPQAKTPAVPPAPPPAPSVQAQLPMKYEAEPDYHVPDDVDPLLTWILCWQRSHNSPAEWRFQAYLRNHIVNMGFALREHSMYQFSVTIEDDKGRVPDVLFCAHTDTVDGNVTPKAKNLCYDSVFGTIFLAKDSPGSCLGADDGVGVWIMLRMMAAGVPGTYLFHRGEECGGLGAKAIAHGEKGWLGQFKVAVEFDRGGTTDIVTHQRGQTECASEKFAAALADRLVPHGIHLKASKHGVYTDVYEYRTIISECVNLSVGYRSQHGTNEELNYAYALTLANAACELDWYSLPEDRDPNKAPAYSYAGYNRRGYNYGSTYGGRGSSSDRSYAGWDDDDDDLDAQYSYWRRHLDKHNAAARATEAVDDYDDQQEMLAITHWLRASNAEIANFIVMSDAIDLQMGYRTLINEIVRLRAKLNTIKKLCDK